MKQVKMFRVRPQVFKRLLENRAGIGEREVADFGGVHARAGSYRRAFACKAAQAPQTDMEQSHELTLADAPVDTPARTPEPVADSWQHGDWVPRPLRPSPSEPESFPMPRLAEEAYG